MSTGCKELSATPLGGEPLVQRASSTAWADIAAGFIGFAGVAATRLIDTLLTWQARARERQHLRMMDGHQLRDLGLTRVDVVSETDKPFWRP